MDAEWYGNTVLSYVVSLGVFVGVLVGLPVIRAVLVTRLQQLSRRTSSDLDDFIIDVVRRYVGAAVYVVTALFIATRSLNVPASVEQLLHLVFVVVLTYKIIQVIQAFLEYGLTKWMARVSAGNPNSQAVVKNILAVVRIVLWLAGVLFVLSNLGVNVTALVTGLGIGGVAVALAAQAILGDTFSSFAIFLDRPFEVGDFIVVGELKGTVQHIGFKTTRLISLDGEQIVFPNSDLTSSRIQNFKRMLERRVEFRLGVTYETPLAKVESVPALVKEIITSSRLTRYDRGHFKEYGDSALIFEFVFFVLSPDYNTYMDIRQGINLRIKAAFEQAGIAFAYPTQQVYLTRNEPAPSG